MAYCDACGHQVGENSKFCSRCGASIEPSRPAATSHTFVRRTGRTKSYWKWGGAIVGTIVVLIIIASVMEQDESSIQARDVIQFGTGEVENSDDLEISGITEEFALGEEIWMRMTLSKGIGDIEVQYFLQSQSVGDSGWSPVASWTNNIDPDSNLFRSSPFNLQILDPANYKVFAVADEKKRAEGTFSVVKRTPASQ